MCVCVKTQCDLCVPVREVDVATLAAVAPPDGDLQVQIVASAAFEEQRVVTTVGGGAG